jgi:prefoldin subunit 5
MLGSTLANMSSASSPLSPSGIPKVVFEEDPGRLVLPGKTIEESILHYRDLTQKFRFLEANLEERLSRTDAKKSELDQNLRVIRMLQRLDKVEQVDVDFELGDSLYARGTLSNPSQCKVHLWLSSGAMVVYSPGEAETMLADRLQDTKSLLEKIGEEQRYLKEQITTAEVNMARLYNHHLSQSKRT